MIGRIYRAIRRRIFPEIRFTEEKRIECSWMGFALKSKRGYFELSSNDFPRITIRRHSTDLLVLKQIFEQREYDFFISKIKQSGKQVSTILDLGGNIGISALYFKHHFPASTVITLEPDLDNYNLLKKNIERTDIVALQAAIWERDQDLEMNFEFSCGGEWARAVQPIGKGTPKVKGYSFNSILSKYNMLGVDVVKMDIEGSEDQIFREDVDLKFLDKIGFISVEIHPHLDSYTRIKAILSDHGFTVYEKDPNLIGVKE